MRLNSLKFSIIKIVYKKFNKKITTINLPHWQIAGLVLLSSLCILFVYTNYMKPRYMQVDPSTYAPLLSLIADAESKGNYNAHFGDASNSSVEFTSMTIAEVLDWQSDFVKKGNPSNAVGRYQIVDTTLSGLVAKNDIDKNKLYDEKMQDLLAVKLLERRGSVEYVNKQLSRDEFAANIAKEWASLPKVVGDSPEDSYYQSDGLNRSLVKVEEVLNAIDPMSPAP